MLESTSKGVPFQSLGLGGNPGLCIHEAPLQQARDLVTFKMCTDVQIVSRNLTVSRRRVQGVGEDPVTIRQLRNNALVPFLLGGDA